MHLPGLRSAAHQDFIQESITRKLSYVLRRGNDLTLLHPMPNLICLNSKF
jgi:hypothetical protein